MIYDYLYLWWKTKLQTIPELKLVDFDWGQDENNGDKENSLINDPAVLISFPGDTDTFDQGNNIQEMNDLLVTLKLVTKQVNPKGKRIRKGDNSLGHFDIARILFKHVQGLGSGMLSDIPEFDALKGTDDDSTLIQSISRVNVGWDQRYHAYIRSTQTFSMNACDFTASTHFQKVAADLCIDSSEFLFGD